MRPSGTRTQSPTTNFAAIQRSLGKGAPLHLNDYVTGADALRDAAQRVDARDQRIRARPSPLLRGDDGVLDGLREAEDISVRILDVEVALAPGPLLKWLDDGSAATDELVKQLADSGDGKICVEMLFGPSVRTLGLKLRSAFEVDHCTIARHAGVEVHVDEVAFEAEALLVEGQGVVQPINEELRGRGGNRGH